MHCSAEVETSLKVCFFNKKGVMEAGMGMGSYFFFDMPLTTIRKRERDDTAREYAFY